MMVKIVLLLCIFNRFVAADTAKPPMPQFQLLSRSQKPDSAFSKSDSTLKITSDSARIITPPVHTSISSNVLPIEIEPRCPVDSVTILVRHSGRKADSLGTFSHPPYRAVWNCENIPDQDQMHLQPGYILFHKSGLKIISPPLAHRWVLDRKKGVGRIKYRCCQKNAPDTSSIDGDLDDWKDTRAAKIANMGYFKVKWSGSHIFLAARIFDSSVTYKDYAEFHFDIYNNKEEFAGINHRSIRFGPKSRSNCFTVNLTSEGFVPADSVNVLLSREMRWARKIFPDGYSVEVSLPFFTLSDLQYPDKTIGFDVSVIDVDEGSEEETFVSWSGSEITSRYNPSQWGNLVLVQALFPIRAAFMVGLVLFSILIFTIVGIQLVQYYKSRKIRHFEPQEYSGPMNRILLCVQQSLQDPGLSPSSVAGALSCTPDEITMCIEKEAGCTFEQFVRFHKIKLSRSLLQDTGHTLEMIASMTGFASAAEFSAFFTEATRVPPEKFRGRKLEEAEDE